MNKIFTLPILVLLIPLLFFSCTRKAQSVSTSDHKTSKDPAMAAPPCIIYQTTRDYSSYVPVELSEDQLRISSFPAVSDILKQGDAVYPTVLANGFLLDNRGIGPNVAFLNITYEAYKQLDETPQAEDLFKQLLDKDPLVIMYQCGNRYQYSDMVTELTKIIESGSFSNCKRLR